MTNERAAQAGDPNWTCRETSPTLWQSGAADRNVDR